jgi:hypothetical protein
MICEQCRQDIFMEFAECLYNSLNDNALSFVSASYETEDGQGISLSINKFNNHNHDERPVTSTP